MKKKTACLFFMVLLLLFTACNQVGVVGELVEEVAGNSYSFGYLYFNDTRKLVLRLDQATQLTLQVLSTSGELDISLWKLNDLGARGEKTLYEGKNMPTGNWPVVLEPGSYEFEFWGRKHTGSINVYYGNKQ